MSQECGVSEVWWGNGRVREWEGAVSVEYTTVQVKASVPGATHLLSKALCGTCAICWLMSTCDREMRVGSGVQHCSYIPSANLSCWE